MKEIAEASGVGRTTVYRHFPSREALLLALFENVYDDAEAAIRAIVAEVQAPRDVFPRIAAEMISIGVRYRFLAAHKDLALELRCRPREDPLRAWIVTGVDAGTLRPLGVAWIQGMITALITAAHEEVGAGRSTLDEASGQLGETMIGAFAA